MGRLSVSNLPYPSDPYRIERLIGGVRQDFETSAHARDEDLYRVKALTKIAARSSSINQNAAINLAQRLVSVQSADRRTLASKRYMRRFRVRIIGALWKFLAESSWTASETSSFTAIPRGWDLSPEELEKAEPSKLLDRFRSQLNRAQAKDASGFLIAFIHGEFEPEGRNYQLHVHGIATGEMIAVLDRLRATPSYSSDRLVRNRMHISRKALKDIPYPLGYPFKSYWPSRRIGTVGHEGPIKRQRGHHRIPEPYHSQVLLWLDRWSPADMTLLMNLCVGREGFVASPQSSVHQLGVS